MSESKLFRAIGLLSVVVVLFVGVSPALADSHGAIANEVMAIARAEWAAFNAKNVAEASKSWADEYTQFSPTFSTRLEGKAQLVRMEEAFMTDSGSGAFSDMLNPKVQVHGDVAILSYNYIGISRDKDGKTEPSRAKSTRVYVKKGGRWMLVHANFGADPLPE